MTRPLVLTSSTSGVGIAAQQAAAVSSHTYVITGISTWPARLLSGLRALPSPATQDREAFQERVLTLVEEVGPCLVVAGRDEDATVLGQVADDLAARGGVLGNGPPHTVQAAYDKALTSSLFAGSALSIAMTAATVRDALCLAGTVGWPILVKPRCGNASRGVRLADNAETLRACFRPGIDIAQELLPFDSQDRRPWDRRAHLLRQDGEYSVQVLIGPRGQDLGCFVSRNNLVDGVPHLVEIVDDALSRLVSRHAREALSHHGAWGAWNFQGRRTPDGDIRIFEVNARFTGLTGMRSWLGFNELDLLYEGLVLQQETCPPPCPPAGLLIELSTAAGGRPAKEAAPYAEAAR
ncbi:hypothetical protein ACH492_05180 [Streptomyces sp. NPDC019443]|uniref:ATP-binding protein n=1 Tax=Streptomyces sp. NPDC019443 TaxID=3365061 RepID=UPI003792CFDA